MRFNKTKYSTRTLVAWLWKHHKGCRLQAIINVVIGLLQVALGLYGVDLLRRLTDAATAGTGNLTMLAVLFGLVLLFEMILNIIKTWVRAVLGVRTQNIMQQAFFSRLLHGEWRGVGKMHSGDILNRLFGDVSDIVSLMTEVVPSVVIITVQFIASFVYLYRMDSALALILVVAAPVLMLLSRYYFRKMRRIVRKIKDSNSALQAIIQESVQNKMVVKVMEQSDNQVGKLERRQAVLRWQIKKRARFAIISKTMVNVGFAGGYLAALIYGLFQLYNREPGVTVGVIMAFTQLIGRIQKPMLDIARLLPTFVNSLTSAERLIELEVLPVEDDARQHHLKGTVGVRLDNVSYKYTDNGREVLRNFSYDFKPGTFTAILGETGAGKTTVIRILLALIKANKGKATIYSDSEQCEVDVSTRCNFSYVPQGNSLFSGTIRENLRFGNPDATTEQMRHALHIAMADFVFELPDGLNTVCGEGGGGLSEGQAQRIAIARAIVRPSKVLLLDEATSALDIDTERELLMRIKQHYHDATVIFVTHRLAVVEFTTDNLRMERNI
ncbi:MAG: ABC transporter ATP-binding protein [Bacteroidaceae bacterium]|nr:ABC transporter ATP-binding protein [Bacteroidaceae bacterium]